MVWLLSRPKKSKKVVLPPGAPSVVLYSFEGTHSARVEVRFHISDPDADNAEVRICYRRNASDDWHLATSADGSANPFNQTLSTNGEEFLFAWDAKFDMGASVEEQCQVAVFVTDDDAEVSDTKDVNVAIGPPSAEIVGVDGSTGNIVVFYRLTDAASDPASVKVYFRKVDSDIWQDATLSASAPESTDNLETSDVGMVHAFLWDSATDLAGYHGDAYIRILPKDEWDFGDAAESPALFVDNNQPPSVTVSTPSDNATVAGMVTVKVVIKDAESDICSVAAWYLDGSTWKTAVLEGQTADLASSPSGVEHTFQWDALTAFGSSASNVDTELLIRVFDAKLGSSDQVNLKINNASLPSITIDEISPDNPACQDVTVEYTVYDGDTPSVDITFEYSVDGGANWKSGTIKSANHGGGWSLNTLQNVPADADGEVWEFVWDSYKDETDKYYDAVLIKLTVSDGVNSSYAVSYKFPLNNMVTNDPPTVTIETPSDGDEVSDLVEVQFTLDDADDDTMRVEVLYSTDGGATYDSATILDGDTTGLSNGNHSVFWDTRANGLGRDGKQDIILKIVPYDPYQVGASDSVDLTVDNRGWSDRYTVATASDDVTSVAVAADTEGTAHILWCLQDGSLYYSRGRYDRLTSPERIGEAYRVSATSFQDTIYISHIYADGVFVKKWTPTGGWEDSNGGAAVLNATGNTVYLASDVAVAPNGRICVVAIKLRKQGFSSFYYIVETHSDDGGESWSSAAQVVSLNTSTSEKVAACFDADNNLHIAYDVDGERVFYVRVTSNGSSTTPEEISASGYDEQRAPDIAFYGGQSKITVVWRGNKFGYTPILLRRIGTVDNTGVTWEPSGDVPDTAQYPYVDNPSCVFSESRFCVVWEGTGSDGYRDIFAKEAQNGSWGQKQNVSNTVSRHSLIPDVAAGGSGNFHTVWADSDSSGNPIICYALR